MSGRHILIVDPQMAGIAGDMFVAALLDLSQDTAPIIAAMEAAVNYVPNCTRVKVTPRSVTRSHIGGLYLDIELEENYTTRPGQVLLDAVETLAKDLQLSAEAAAYANRAIRHLVEAEAFVHRHPKEKVHLHGAGSVDTVIDVIGAATALDALSLADSTKTEYYVLPIAVGGGSFPSGHGQLTAPGPAVTQILTQNKLSFRGGPLSRELTTPTGAALLAALNPTSVQAYPLFTPLAVGYGAGTGELPEIPNLLKVVHGTVHEELRLYQDEVLLIETNVDDVTGETLGYLVQELLNHGAKDVSIISTTTKKNRPGHLLSVIAAPEDEERLAYLLIAETGSLGVRVSRRERHLLAREIQTVTIHVNKQEFTIRVKIASDRTGKIMQVKAEYEDVKVVAEKTGQPLMEIAQKAEAVARKQTIKKR